MTRAELIAALERADGPSRELDAEIWLVLHGPYGEHGIKEHAPECSSHRMSHVSPNCDCGADNIRNKAAWARGVACQGAGHFPEFSWLKRWTASIDCALQLVPEGWRIYSLADLRHFQRDQGWFCGLDRIGGLGAVLAKEASTPALALCIASLRAQDAS